MLRRPNGVHPFGNKLSAGGKRPKDGVLARQGCKMLMGVTRTQPYLLRLFVERDLLLHSVFLGLVFTLDAETLKEALQLVQHVARLKGAPMGPRKLEALKSGGIELIVKALKNYPLDFIVKRYACEAAEILVTGEGDWKEEARELMRGAKVTALAEIGLDKLSHFVGSRKQVTPASIRP